jgi:predicted kinase
MPKLHVLIGLPGTGKSTLTEKIADLPNIFVYSTDALIEEYAAAMGWSYNFAFEKYVAQATKRMDEMLATAIAEGKDVIWDQTNVAAKKRRSIVAKFPKNYFKEAIVITPPTLEEDVAEWEYRLANRPGKVIPDFVMNSMKNNFTYPTADEGFNCVSLYDMYGNELEATE